jgi:dTDP-glucose pyrophosphorylase/CBS domain-containing protein
VTDLTPFLIGPDTTIREAMVRIDANQRGIVLVVGPDRRLLGTVTDGDIRRAILSGLDLELTVSALVDRKPARVNQPPLTVTVGTSVPELLETMNRHDVRHLPIVDGDRIVDIAFLADLIKEYQLPLRAMIMAGGFGTRLKPLTDQTPKSMLRVGDRPLLELIVRQLQQAGIRRVNLATHYKADVIEQHFGDGTEFSVDIQYVNEHRPLGTAGAIGLLSASHEPLLVINGDILTQLDFAAMLEFHRTHGADMTIAVRPSEFHVPYGVVETAGVDVVAVSEKPVMRYFVNAGIYLLNPDVCEFVPNGQHYDMPDLIGRLIAERRRVISFPVHEYWRDIGKTDDYRQAVADAEKGGL